MFDYRLKTFIAVTEAGSFSAASKKLNLSVSAVKKHIEGLEFEWETKLFNRFSTGVTLTEDGNYLFNRSIEIVEMSQLYLANIPSLLNRSVNIRIANRQISFPEKLTKCINDFRKSHPEYHISIYPYFDNEMDHPNISVLSNEYDLILFPAHDCGFSKTIAYIPLLNTQLYCAVDNNSPLNEFKQIDADFLNGYTIIMPSEGQSVKLDTIRTLIQKKAPESNIIEKQNIWSIDSEKEVILLPESVSSIFQHLNLIPMTSEFQISLGFFTRKPIEAKLIPFLTYCKEQLSDFDSEF